MAGVFPSKAQEHVVKASTHGRRRIRRHLNACGSHFRRGVVQYNLQLNSVSVKWEKKKKILMLMVSEKGIVELDSDVKV